jgi:predicted PurR-regulated permease PerM
MIRKAIQLLLVLVAIFTTGYVLYQSFTIVLYFVVAAVLALIGRPIMRVLAMPQIKGRRLGEAARAFITMLFMVLVLTAIVGVFLPMIVKEASHLAQMDGNEVRRTFEPGLQWLNDVSTRFGGADARRYSYTELLEYVFNSLDISMITNVFNTILGAFGNFLIAVFSVAFITFFMLKERDMIGFLVLSVTPGSKEEQVKRVLHNVRHTLSRYFLGLLVQVTAIATCMYIGLSIFGIKNALLIAFFTGLANLIPYIGPWIGACFGAFIIVANGIELSLADYIQPRLYGLLISVIATQLLDNYVFQPTIFSNSINAHPLEVFAVILVAGTLGGVAGMVAALPVYAVIRIGAIEVNREWRILERIKSR